MPWALNEATRTISPTKTLEYMAGGKPIVSTAVRDVVRDHGDLVFVADGPRRSSSSWRARRRDRFDAGRAEAGRQRAEEHGWDATAEAMRRLIAEPLEPADRPRGPAETQARRAHGRRHAEPDRRRRPRRPQRRPAPRRPRLHPRRQARPHRRSLPLDRPGRIHVRPRRPHLLHDRQVRRRPLPRRPRGQLPRAAARELGLPLRRVSALSVPGQPLRPAARRSSRNACSGVIEASATRARRRVGRRQRQRQRQRQRPRRRAAQLPGVEPAGPSARGSPSTSCSPTTSRSGASTRRG